MISIQDLSYHYPDGTKAINNISLSIESKERVALIGANGSGKSTLFLLLTGIYPRLSGTITISQRVLSPESLPDIRNSIGLVFQNPDEQLFMSKVREDIAFGPLNQGITGISLDRNIQTAMRLVNLDPDKYSDRYTHHLSGGEKKRVAIAGILAMNPDILLLDEPTAQLDPRNRRNLIKLLSNLDQTQLIATHDLELAKELCPRTIMLDHGTIVYDGVTSSVITDEDFLVLHSL